MQATMIDANSIVETPELSSSTTSSSNETEMILDFVPKFSTLKQKEETIHLTWTKMDYSVGKKKILNGISGEVSPGEVVAIMGPSGSGKSTLLNTLAGRVQIGHGAILNGVLRVNGQETVPSHFRKHIAYVTQDDALFATSTVREALEFSARLRLPNNLSKSARDTLVEDMIQSLGLVKCQNTMIGNELIRGLSGGERKRVAIGVELVSNPACLFLDEPTSGLDSFSAWKVLRILNAIAETGCTILCSIHQPSTEVFNEFSSLILLSAGNVVYQGAIKDVDPTFRTIGLGVPINTNIADHVMFVVQTRPPQILPNDNLNTRRYNGTEPKFLDEESHGKSKTYLTRAVTSVTSFYSNKKNQSKPEDAKAGFMIQSWILAVRESKGLFRDTAGLIARFGSSIFLAVLMSVIFLGAGNQNSNEYSVNTHYGAMVIVWMLGLFSAAQPALLTFPTERVVFIRERATGTYGSLPYVLSKAIVELPLMFSTSLLVMLITYWAMDFGGNFIYLVLSLWGDQLAAVSTAMVLGAVVPNAKAAIEVAPIVLVPQILFLGLFVRIQQMPIWLQWVQYLVGTRYSLSLASVTEFQPSRAINADIQLQWASLLTNNNMTESMLWFYALLLVIIIVGLRVISLILLNEKAKRF